MTDQSGAFPEARTAWDSLIDVVTAYVNDRPVPGGDSDRAVVLAAIERARAALERPRPAPPEPEIAKRLRHLAISGTVGGDLMIRAAALLEDSR